MVEAHGIEGVTEFLRQSRPPILERAAAFERIFGVSLDEAGEAWKTTIGVGPERAASMAKTTLTLPPSNTLSCAWVHRAAAAPKVLLLADGLSSAVGAQGAMVRRSTLLDRERPPL